MIPESPRDPARAVDQDGAGAPQKSAPSRGISTTSLTTVSGPKIPLTAQRDISTQSPVLAERSWHKASTWLRETYRDRGKTILMVWLLQR